MNPPISPDEFKSLFPDATKSAIERVARAWDEHWKKDEGAEAPVCANTRGAVYDPPPISTSEPESHFRDESVGSVSGTQSNSAKHRVVYKIYRRRLCDVENIYTKSCTDFLREIGFIPNDDPKSIELKVVQIQVKTPAEEGTEVTVFPPGTW